MRCIFGILICLFLSLPLCGAEEGIPYLSYRDLEAIYPKNKTLIDWVWPSIKIDNEAELINLCKKDFSKYYLSANLRAKYPIITGDITKFAIMKDPDNKIIYLVFKVEPPEIAGLKVVYFYDPSQKQIILKTLL